MKKQFGLAWASLLFLCLSSAYAAINSEFNVAPMLEGDVMDADEETDPFVPCPVYRVEGARQIYARNGWQGETDFSAAVRVCWTQDGIYMRFDIIDDINEPMEEGDPKMAGDHIRVHMAHRTCGPDRDVRQPWTITLSPSPEESRCGVEIKANEKFDLDKVGEPSTEIFTTEEGYSVLLEIPYEQWDDPPRNGGMTRFQVTFVDHDPDDEAVHHFTLFPVRRGSDYQNNFRTYGKIRFAEKYWVKVYPSTDVVQGDSELIVLCDAGNLTEGDLEAVVSVELDSKDEDKKVEQEVSIPLPKGEYKQEIPVKFDLSEMPSGTYKVKAKADIYFDTGSFKVRHDSKSGMTYVKRLVKARKKSKSRALAAYKSEEVQKDTFRFMAGGGKVLWHAGRYDASSKEFPQLVRRLGPHELEIPTAGNRDVPWALFGGLSALDGTNEPLVLKMAPAFGKLEPAIGPQNDLVTAGRAPGKQPTAAAKRLLLVGVSAMYIDADSAPEIHITSGEKTLLKEVIRPSDDLRGRRHATVFRVWLGENPQPIRIENSAAFGTHFEIDFLALLAGGNETGFDLDEPSITFSGNETATRFGKMLATSLFFARHYLIGKNGQAYTSLPGGRYRGTDVYNNALLMNELPHWGAVEDAKNLTRAAPKFLGGDQLRRSRKSYEITHPLLITGMYNVWRKANKDSNFLRPLWLSTVHRPTNTLMREVADNPLGLVNAKGVFGSQHKDLEGATLPMYFAVNAAAGAAIQMAVENDNEVNAIGWRQERAELQKSFQKELVTPENSLSISSQESFPGGWGLGEQAAVIAILPANCWLFGRYESKNPILYNKNVRVFDTPYVFSGLPFHTDFHGYQIGEDMAAQIQATYDYLLLGSPVFQKSTWQHHYLVDYRSTSLQLWTVMAGFLIDSTPIASKALSTFVNYTFDEGKDTVQLPNGDRADIEISPYTFEERLNISNSGDNLGGTFDDLNVESCVLALKTARLLAGVDDHDGNNLKLIPRLPENWNKVELNKWSINHNFVDSKMQDVYYSYEEIAEGRYNLQLDCPERFKSITVRFGPFSPKTRKVRISNAGTQIDARTIPGGFFSWATHTFKGVNRLDVTAQARNY